MSGMPAPASLFRKKEKQLLIPVIHKNREAITAPLFFYTRKTNAQRKDGEIFIPSRLYEL